MSSHEIYAFSLRTLAREERYHGVQEDGMTYAEELLQEGLEKGLEQGLEKGVLEGKRAVLIRQLSRRFSVSDDERRRIESCDDPAALDAALDEVVTADSKDAVLAKLP